MTGQELVAFAKSKLGVPYVYGMKGKVMTEAIYNSLKKAYGNLVWDSDKQKIGKVCCDCSGLISWATGIARNSQNYHDTALEVQPIATYHCKMCQKKRIFIASVIVVMVSKVTNGEYWKFYRKKREKGYWEKLLYPSLLYFC